MNHNEDDKPDWRWYVIVLVLTVAALAMFIIKKVK
jgi:hypothetical protein